MIDRILVVAPHLRALTDYARTLDALTARRCQVHIAVHSDPLPGTDLSSFTGKFHRLTIGSAPPPDKWVALGSAVRGRLDRWQLLERHPVWEKALKAIERRLPSSPRVLNFIRAHEPDAVIVVPIFGGGTMIPGYVQAAAELGIATVGFPSHWDDLTRGAVLHRLPDCLALWNRFQRRQVVETCGVPARRTTVLGASLALDIVRQTSPLVRDRERSLIFCAPGASPDPDRLARWIEGVRTSPDPLVRDAHLLIHLDPPGGVQQMPHVLPGDVEIVPRVESDPAKYSADVAGALASADVVVVWDTTMLFEAAARGIRVAALLWPESTDPALARFCADESMSRGWLIAARTLVEHTSSISALLATPLSTEQRAAARALVRPHGPDLLPGFILSARALQEVIDRRAKMPPAAPAPAWARGLLSPLATLALRANQPIPRCHDSRFARVLVGVSSAKSLFLHQPLLRVLAERGHQLRVVFTAREGFPVELYDKVKCDIPNVTVAGVLPERDDAWAAYSHWLLGVFSLGSLAHRRSAGRRAPLWFTRYVESVLPGRARRLGSLMRRVPLAARVMPPVARALARLIPSSAAARTLILHQSPDVVAVLPDDDAVSASESAGTQLDLIGAAESLRVPVITAAGASELQAHPLAMSKARVICVWNDEQRRAAVNLGAPADRVVVSGALPLDRALHEHPLVDEQAFRDMLGLPSDRPFVLFAGSSGLMSEPAEEVDLIRGWVKSVRTSGDAALRQLVVLIRPSPFGTSWWRKLERDDDVGGGVVLCPREFHRTGELDAVLLAESVRFAALTISADPLTLLIAAGLGRPAALVLPPRFATPGDAIPLDYLLRTEGSSVRYIPTLAGLSEYAREVLNGWQAPSADQFRRIHLQPRPDVVPAVAVADCIEKAVAESRRARITINASMR